LSKTALIVDDSKSARVVLKRMLETHELDVDTAESAEDALVYLNDNRPDVIFMDHLMPGMDGFEAVSAIKNNPDTATIPIMMYTSQQGELYVGQARALGAVGVLPKQVEPVEVSKVLESLRVIRGETGRVEDEETDENAITGDYPNLETLDQDLKLLIQDLFDQQRAVLRRDLLDSYESIATRVADEIRTPEVEDLTTEEPILDNRVPTRLQYAIAVLAVIAMVFAWLYAQREQSWQELQQQSINLQRALEEQQESEAAGTINLQQQLSAYQQSMGSAFLLTLQALEWGVNQSSQYDFDELPLGNSRLNLYEELSDQLLGMAFSGVVRIETHVGNFCMVDAGAAGYQLADTLMPAQQCNRIGFELGEAYELGLRQSVAFANFVNTANDESGGRIRYDIVSLGSSDPLMDYPATTAGLDAGAWNEIAASNNRVEVSLFPDP
jgi:CheY-like chemotaxis protein